MFVSRSVIVTENARRCLTRLCRHWSHRFAVQFDETQGEIFFDPAYCRLKVLDGELEVQLDTPVQAELDELEEVVAEHLQRMAGEECLSIEWGR